MKPAQHDRCYGRRLARNGLRVTRSDRQPYAWERLADYRARAAPFDREVAAQCAINAWRAGASPAAAVERGTRYLRSLHGHRHGLV